VTSTVSVVGVQAATTKSSANTTATSFNICRVFIVSSFEKHKGMPEGLVKDKTLGQMTVNTLKLYHGANG
jgi:hypothetical protein